MPKISSGGQFIFIKIMSWPAAKSTGANTECKVCRASYSEYFFIFFLNKNIGLHDNTVSYDLNSLLQHLSWNQQNYAGKELGSS